MQSTTTTTKTKGSRLWPESTLWPDCGKSQKNVYMTIVTVLLMLQTQHFILTMSPPADL